MSTPETLGDLAESLVPVAQQLIGAVHDDGPAAVARVFAILPPEHLPALAVVLAGMCDPDKTVGDMLAWVDWDGGPARRDPTLFDGAKDPNDPKSWTDAECHLLWRQYRSVSTLTDMQRVQQLRGYREWERRYRSRKRRTGAAPQTGL